jgi:hypothetical protein
MDGLLGAISFDPRESFGLFEGLLASSSDGPEFRTMSRLRSGVPKFGSHAVADEYLLAAPAQPGSVLLQTLLDCAIVA